jgi:hypothetical protein
MRCDRFFVPPVVKAVCIGCHPGEQGFCSRCDRDRERDKVHTVPVDINGKESFICEPCLGALENAAR